MAKLVLTGIVFWLMKMELLAKRQRKQQGFTLTEMLIVMSVILTITSVSLLHLSPLATTKKIDFFLAQLKEDLLYTQQSALSWNQSTKILFQPDQHFYEVWKNGEQTPLLKRKYDEEINIEFGTLTNPIYFSTNGNVRKAGSMIVLYGEKRFKIVFQLGRGRFYVEKL